MMPWANIWKTEPLSPASVSVAAPSMTSPMCETDEYAMTYLRSVWAIAESAPYTTLTQAIVPTSQVSASAPSGRSPMPTRTTPYAPSVINTPAWSIETAVGADAWPSGDHVG